MKKIILLILTTAITVTTFAQAPPSVTVKKKWLRINPYFTLDSRNSFVGDEAVSVRGLKLGMSVNEKTRVGLGVYFIPEVEIEAINKAGRSINVLFKYNYVNAFYDRVLFKNFRWEFSMPLAFGSGKAIIHNVGKIDGVRKLIRTKREQVVTANITGEYKIRPWVGLSAGGGYRYLITDEPRAKKIMNQPFYSYGVVLYLDYWLNFVFSKEKNKELMSEFFEARDTQKAKRKRTN